MLQKDNLTDLTEKLPENDNEKDDSKDDFGNQQVISSDDEIITLGENNSQKTGL